MLKTSMAFALLSIAVGCGQKSQNQNASSDPKTTANQTATETKTPMHKTASATKTSTNGNATKTETVAAKNDKKLPEAVAAKSDVSAVIATWADTEKYIADHKGKVVVVDLWATYCVPCKKEFPGLVKLHDELGDAVVCVSFSLDYEGLSDTPVEKAKENCLKFLKKMNARFHNVICSTPSDEFYDEQAIAGIPVVRVYGKDGKLAKQFDVDGGIEFSYEKDIRPLVENLIGNK